MKAAEVQAALEDVRPHLQMDGGDVELVEITDDGVVKVKLTGSCAGCPRRQRSRKGGGENDRKKKIPEVKSVESV